ncbi:MAG TPA: SDR family oxidoreductase [Acidimicrobiia bacterium]|nr:SDR family oxidoreductase [Acidimicrobiia bacterium]
MARLGGRVAVVTGGASGIGHATAVRLAEEGATVVVADIDAAGAHKVADDVGGSAFELDVTEPAAWQRLVDQLSGPAGGGGVGGVDIAFLNAGVATGEDRITELTDAAYRRIMSINVDGVVFGVRALVPLIAGRGGGAIVATSSLAGIMGFAPDPIYTLTKHAVVGLVRSLAPQLERDGITINAICPGITDTPLVSGVMRHQLEQHGFPMMPPEQIAAAVVDAVLDGRTGRALVCQPGREPTEFRFSNVPGPAGEGVKGARPPGELRMDRTAD